jgi:hypothetical protein
MANPEVVLKGCDVLPDSLRREQVDSGDLQTTEVRRREC